MTLTIDIRKLRDSGVGTCLINVLPKVFDNLPSTRVSLIGNADDPLVAAWGALPNTTLIDYHRRPYSPLEQLELLQVIPKETTLLWTPFINIPLLYRGKMLVTFYDMIFLAVPGYLNAPQRLYARILFQGIRRKAAHVLTISEFSKKEYMRLVAPESKNVTVTLLAAAPKWFEQAKASDALEPEPYFLFVGNVKPHKNLSRLLDAFQQIKDRVPHHLVIIGRKDGFIVGDANLLDVRSDLAGRVRFTGYLGDESLRTYFARATALVFPSLYEGFGLPPLEAMACGCPVIASNTTSIPEACGDAALYCDPLSVDDISAKMLQMANNEPLRQELIAKGQRQAQRFSWDDCAAKTVAVIRSLLQS